MSKDFMHYKELMDRALRSVVRDALVRVAKSGLPGSHHMYITFRTRAPGVDIADRLRERFPDDMTIVLQHQFWGLEVSEEHFEVTLSFNKLHERLVIPFAAITSFVDPAVQFGLQFVPTVPPPARAKLEVGEKNAPPPAAAQAPEEKAKSGQVVTLDAFRKK
jgi:uncharacterized protein